MSLPRILIVEDEAIVSMDIRNRLSHLGYDGIGEAATGEQSIRMTGELRPDLVLMDIRLGGAMDGIKAAELIRKRFRRPVIFLSAYSEDTVLQRAKVAEPFGFLIKPFQDRELKTAIEMALYKHQAETEILRLNRIYAVLSEINQMIVRARAREEILQQACQIVIEHGGFKMAWIGWLDPSDHTMRTVAQYGAELGCLNPVLPCLEEADAFDPRKQVLVQGKTVIVNRLASSPCPEAWRARAIQSGFQAMAAVPIRLQGEVRGAMAIFSTEAEVFKEKETKLIEEVALDISFGLDKSEEEARRLIAETALQQSLERSQRQQQAAAVVAVSPRVAAGEWEFLSREITELAARITGVARAAVWFFNEGQTQIRCVDLYEASSGRHGSGAVLPPSYFQSVFEALKDSMYLAADEPLTDSRTSSCVEGYLQPLGITALLEAAIRTSEQNLGVLSLEHVGKTHHWAEDEIAFVCQLADQIALTISIAERLKVSAQLRQSQAELHAVYMNAPVIMCLLDSDRRIRRINRAGLEFMGRTEEECIGLVGGDLLGCLGALENPRGCGYGPHCANCVLRLHYLDTLQTGQSHYRFEFKPTLLRGKLEVAVILLASTARIPVGQERLILLCLEDITERRRLEEQLRQSQKMEVVGQLVGGVAHDFNNILASFMMHLSLLQADPQLSPEIKEVIEELQKEAKRGGNLTRQLLMVSRQQVMRTRPLDLNEVLVSIYKMLKRFIGEHIDFSLQLNQTPVWVEADVGMMEQVIMNLCINARDAMPRGGSLGLELKVVELQRQDIQTRTEARPGRYAQLLVTDTGFGIQPSILPQIFEPFFTTKEAGKGTGLGLTTVYGIVKQHQGWIEVDSQVGQGSHFRVYLPAIPNPIIASAPPPVEPVKGGSETLLLVEDEDSLRHSVAAFLRHLGYTVLTSANGQEALQVWSQSGPLIDLLLTDMVMPGEITGLDLAQRLRQEKNSLKVVISSGYSTELSRHGWSAEPHFAYLSKPYSGEVLAKLVRQCLDSA